MSTSALRRSTLDAHRARMNNVVRYMSAHLDDVIDPVMLGRIGGLSPRQLERVFTRTMGETPRAFARRLRLERAAMRLRQTRASILAIAIEAGFQSHEAFTRVFRVRFGHTPAAYRRMRTSAAQPRARVQLWQLIAASALRPYVEAKRNSPARQT